MVEQESSSINLVEMSISSIRRVPRRDSSNPLLSCACVDLLVPGSIINGVNQRGNTPLHICAVMFRNKGENYTFVSTGSAYPRVLLFRDADPTIVNKSNQTTNELALVF